MGDIVGPLGGVLEWLWRASWQASAIVVVVLAAQALFGRWLSPRWRVAMWSLVVLRLLAPVSPPSDVSMFNLVRQAPGWLTPEPPPAAPGLSESGSVPVTTARPATSPAAPLAGASTSGQGASASDPGATWPLVCVWLGVAAAIIAVTVRNNRRAARSVAATGQTAPEHLVHVLDSCCRQMRLARRPRLLQTDQLACPALIGAWRPTILLPPDLLAKLSEHELRYVLLHEAAHVKRRDVWMNWLLVVLNAVHWFNPVLWFAFARFRADRELACDAMVLRRLDGSETRDYGRMLIKVLEHLADAPRLARLLRSGAGLPGATGLPGVVAVGEGKRQLRRRVGAIARFGRSTSRWSVLGAMPLLLLACVSLTDAKDDKPSQVDVDAEVTPAQAKQKVQEQVQELLREAYELHSAPEHDPDGRAMALVDRALELDPQNVAAQAIKSVIENAKRDGRTGSRVGRTRGALIGSAAGGAIGGSARARSGVPSDDVTSAQPPPARRQSERPDLTTHTYDIRDISVVIDSSGPKSDESRAKQRAERRQHCLSLARLVGADSAEVLDTGSLVVRATPRQHQTLRALLREVRSFRGVQVNVESRVLIVAEGLLKELNLDAPAHRDGGVGSSLIDDLQVAAILRAAESSPNAGRLTPPRITFFDAQEAWIGIERQVAYVADFRKAVVGGKQGFEPVLANATCGVALGVRGTVSEDLRHVTLTLDPELQTIVEIKRVPYKGGPPGLFVETPEMEVWRPHVTLTVPDRTTVLLISDRLENARLPDGPAIEGPRRIMLLAKPTVIVRTEEETPVFPGLIGGE